MNKKKLIIVSHCVLNTAAKVYSSEEKLKDELNQRKQLLNYIIENDIQLLQLPCPEFLMYGSKRWGHVSEQFDNPFFINQCNEMLKPIILQIKEYTSNDRFEILGVLGINGSPSCGVDYTCSSNEWYGEFSTKEDIWEIIHGVKCIKEKGIMIKMLKSMLEKENIKLKFVAIDKKNMENVYNLLK